VECFFNESLKKERGCEFRCHSSIANRNRIFFIYINVCR